MNSKKETVLNIDPHTFAFAWPQAELALSGFIRALTSGSGSES